MSVGVAMVTCLPVENVILVSGKKESIPLQASSCHGRQIFDWAEDRRQRLMICDEREASTVKICVKLSEALHNTKGFLVNLTVILLCGVQRARSKGNGPLCSVRHGVRKNSAQAVGRGITCHMKR